METHEICEKKNGNTASVNRTFQQSVHSVLLFIFNVTACAAKKKQPKHMQFICKVWAAVQPCTKVPLNRFP